MPSVASTKSNADELPFRLMDALGHQTEVTYNAESAGSSRLVVTYRNVADNSTRKVILDGGGRLVDAVVEELGRGSTPSRGVLGGEAWRRC